MDQIAEGIASIKDSIVQLHLTVYLGFLAEAQARTGQHEQALVTVDEALTLLEKTRERHWEAELHRIKAKILLAKGDQAGAESNLQMAIDVARRQEAKSWELRAAIDFSRLWQSIGEKEKAWHTLAETYAWFKEGFGTDDLIAAKKLLSELI
jgi:predicted ATPase